MARTDHQRPAPVAPVTLSTRAVARLLGVGEATVKRWADEGLLECRKTPGGHRRFALTAIAAFRAKRPGWAETWPAKSEKARERLLELALRGDGEGLTRLVMAGVDEGLTVEGLCDDWLGPMLVEVGLRWQDGRLEVAQEHVVSAAVTEMLSQTAPFLQAEPVEGAALTGCLPGERHELGARMAGLVLRSKQMRVIHSGADTPVDDFLAEALREKVGVVCIGAQMPLSTRSVDELRRVGAWSVRSGIAVFAGGHGFDGITAPEGVRAMPSMRALSEGLSTLRIPVGGSASD